MANTLNQAFEGREDFVHLWSFAGPEDATRGWLDIWAAPMHTVLADEDESHVRAYRIGENNPDGDGFALYPRHFVIDRQGRLAYVSAQVRPESVIQAIERVLAE